MHYQKFYFILRDPKQPSDIKVLVFNFFNLNFKFKLKKKNSSWKAEKT